MSENPTSLFLYGTLMPGQMRWPALEPYALWAEPATAEGRLWDTGRGYPAARFDDEAHSIPGALVGIAPALLADLITALDHMEAEGVLYRRVHVVTSGGPAISYEWLGPIEGLRPLPEGWSAARARLGRASESKTRPE